MPPIDVEFDEFTEDILPIQLVRAAIARVAPLPLRNPAVQQRTVTWAESTHPFLGGHVMGASAKASRRGSRRNIPAPGLEGPAGGPGPAHRVLAFESYVGFQHDYIGLLAGLIVAMGLLTRWRFRTSRIPPRR